LVLNGLFLHKGEPERSGINMRDLAIKKAMENAKASIEIEGLKVTKESEELVYQRLNGNISEKEFLERVVEIVKRPRGEFIPGRYKKS
jgi:hypothetical protein